MKNIVLDIVMGLLCIVLTFTIIGLMVVPIVLEAWGDMRNRRKIRFMSILNGEVTNIK